jgi:hypothetical protein
MRKTLLFSVICLLASAVLAVTGQFQPLNVKTGLWQVNGTSVVSGLPPISPEMQARMAQMSPEQRAKMEAMMKSTFGGTPQTISYKKCVTTKDLNTNPWTNGPDEKCNWTVLNSTGSDMEVQGSSCEAGKNQGMNTDLHIKLHAVDSENVTASIQGTLTGNGHTVNINGTRTGKWLGASCPAETN